MRSPHNRPMVGLGVCVLKNGKVLLGKRKNVHGDDSWSFPGGHLEQGENWEGCARRETLEEAGIEISNLRFATVTNDIFPDDEKHYVTIIMLADYLSGKVQNLEPHKCHGWQWFPWKEEQLPSPLFLPLQNLQKQDFHPIGMERAEGDLWL
ncbi:MAG: NUDIX hydrolase [Spirochaetaceae bacterium]|nr:NUDIX hydrolase [Spirochaetaceae bacterium]